MREKKTIVTFYSGMRTIGGTIIAVEYNQSRVIFDFGMINSEIFDGELKPRTSSMVKDYLKLGIIPRVEGIFSREDLGGIALEAADESQVETAVLISHMHLDHMALIGLLDERIPIYVSNESKELYNGLCKIGEKQPGNDANLCGVDYDIEFNIGDITIIPIQVDHDVSGACGFKIITPDGEIVYTGDVRFHGMHPEITHQFIEKCRDTDVLITEGVTISFIEDDYEIIANKENPEGMMTEINLMDAIKKTLEETEGIAFINYYNRNISRISNLLDMINLTDRKLVLEPKYAKLCRLMLNREDFLVLSDRNSDREVTIDEINKNPSKYLLEISYETSLLMLDLDVKNGIYIHSNGAPLGAYDPSYQHLQNLLSAIDLEFRYIGCGGHALPEQIKYLVDTINPKVLVPYHSFHPERLVGEQALQVLPKPHSRYELKEGTLTEIEV